MAWWVDGLRDIASRAALVGGARPLLRYLRPDHRQNREHSVPLSAYSGPTMSITTLLETKRPPTGPRTAHRPTPEPVATHAGTMPTLPQPGSRPSPGRQAVLALPAEVRWVPAARRSVAAVLTQWRFPSTDRESAELVVGELAANAAQHGHHDMTVHLSLHTGVLRISVTDSGAPARPRPPRDSGPEEHGRGLSIVELLSHEVRVSQSPLGRRVEVVLGASTPNDASR